MSAVDLRPQDPDGWRLGVTLAVIAHGVLVLLLTLGVQWKVERNDAVEAEVWAEIPRAAAPALPPQEAVQPPEPEPVEPPPVAPPPPPPPPEPEVRQPDIVIAKTPPKKEEPPKPRKQPVEVFETAPPKPSKKALAEAEKKAAEKQAAEKKAAEKKAAEKKAAEKLAAEREAQRKMHLARMMSELGASGGTGATPGASAQSAGPSATYAGRIKAHIKPNIVFTEIVSGNPVAVVEVRCAANGQIISRRLLSSSGIPGWDDAVLRAIDRTEVLPPNEVGRVPPVLQIEFRPKDF